MNNEVLFSGE